jgi:hypothetical protein
MFQAQPKRSHPFRTVTNCLTREKNRPFLKSEPVLLQKRLKACRKGFNHATPIYRLAGIK